MGKESQTLRDLLASVITGTTLNTTTTTTDLIRMVVDDTGLQPALRVSVSGTTGGSYPTSPTFTNVNITGDLHVSGNTYEVDQYIVDELYICTPNVMNSWKFIMSGSDLLIQTYSGTGTTYLTKSTITG